MSIGRVRDEIPGGGRASYIDPPASWSDLLDWWEERLSLLESVAEGEAGIVQKRVVTEIVDHLRRLLGKRRKPPHPEAISLFGEGWTQEESEAAGRVEQALAGLDKGSRSRVLDWLL